MRTLIINLTDSFTLGSIWLDGNDVSNQWMLYGGISTVNEALAHAKAKGYVLSRTTARTYTYKLYQ